MSENHIHRVLPEIWLKIAGEIHSSKDLVNISKAIPAFYSAIYMKRVEWLCYQVLPVLVTTTYSNSYDRFRKEFLNCRLVCKNWKFAVDNFLENNVLHYPASGNNVNWKLNKCHNNQIFYLERTETIFRTFSYIKLERLLREASDHPGKPIIGGYLDLHVPGEENRELGNLVGRFVETFGRRIYYLKINFVGKINPIVFLRMLICLLQNTPNLKGLAVSKISGTSVCPTEEKLDELKNDLNQFKTNKMSNEIFRKNIPKLETLNVDILGLADDILKQIIIDMLCSESLKSLTVVKYLINEGSRLDFSNLLHLSLNIRENDELESVLNLNCPNLRKLDLSKVMFHDLDYDLLCKVIQKFQGTITHLSLHLPDLLQPVTSENKMKMIRFFTTPGQLQMPNIKSLSLFGCCALSLNFVCGDNFGPLEYLNLFLEHEIENEGTSLNYAVPEGTNEEITDVLEHLGPVWTRGQWEKKPDLYKSNIWNAFPKLKGILVDSYWEPLNLHGWTYRRNEL